MQGRVLSVQAEQRGAPALDWTGNLLRVTNAADFSPDGGTFTLDGDPTVHAYTSVLPVAAPQRVLVIGDSIAEGTGATTLASRWVNVMQTALRQGQPGAQWPFIPAQYATSAPGRPSSYTGNVVAATFGLGWRALTLMDTTAKVTFNFTGTSAAIIVTKGSTGGVVTYQVDGGPVVSFDTNSGTNPPAVNVHRIPVTFASGGAHTVVVGTTTSGVVLHGLATWDGDEASGVRVIDGSHHGWRYGHVATSSTLLARMEAAVADVQPDLIISAFGTNDMTANDASFQSYVQTFVNSLHAAAPSTPVVMWWPYKSSNHTEAAYASHRAAVAAVVAADPLLSLVDMRPSMPDVVAPVTDPANQGMYADTLHPSDKGMARIAASTLGVVPEAAREDALVTEDVAPLIPVRGSAALVHTPLWDVWAEVEVSGAAGAVQALVPHSMRPVLQSGIRDEASRETVQIERVGEQWVVADVAGQKPVIEDTAFYIPDREAIPRTQMTERGFEVVRGTIDEPYTAAELGGEFGDSLLMQTPEGDLFGFTGGGDMVGHHASLSSLTIGGEDVLSAMDGRNRVTGWFRSISGTPPRFGANEMGLFEMSATCRAGRLYEFGGHVNLWCATASSVRLSLRFTNGTDAASTPVPSVTSTPYRDVWVHLPASTWVSVNLTSWYEGQYPNLGQYATRWLWTASNQTGNHEVQMAVSTAGSVVGVMKELGMPVSGGDWSLGGGTPYTAGTTPTVAPGTRTYKTTWRATAVRSFKLGGSYSDVLYSGSYEGDQRASWLLYGGVALAEDQDPRYPSHAGQSLLSALAGASNLGGWTTLKCTRTWAYSGADVKLSWHGQTSIPGSQPSAGTSPVVSHWTAGTSTRGIPAAELPRLQSGASRGLIIGDNSGQATNTTYAQHSAVLGDSTLTLTYTK